jgi:putative flippase GtrA
MKKPIIYIFSYSNNVDLTAPAMIKAGFQVAVPYDCPWAFDGLTLIPKSDIDKRGKIRGGLKYLHDQFKDTDIILAEEYVTAEDILIVYANMQDNPEAIVLSERENPAGDGKFEKTAYKIIKTLFAVVQGKMVHDMHSGVRSIPYQYLSTFYDMPGKEENFLMGQIMSLRKLNIPLVQCRAITQGKSSAAHTVRGLLKDILKVCMLFLMFVSSSLLSTAVDYGIFVGMSHFFSVELKIAQTIARLISSIFNFCLNQSVVFKQEGAKKKWRLLVRYYMLVLPLWALDLLGLSLFVNVFGVGKYIAKPIVGLLIYSFSFIFQRDFVFKNKKKTDTQNENIKYTDGFKEIVVQEIMDKKLDYKEASEKYNVPKSLIMGWEQTFLQDLKLTKENKILGLNKRK